MAVCARCGKAIDGNDCFEIRGQGPDQFAHLCRSEHVVAWVLRGAQWQLEKPWEAAKEDLAADGSLHLIRHRDGESITRDFANAEDLRAWASAGAFWGEN